MTKAIKVTNRHGATFTVIGVKSESSATGSVWCVRMRQGQQGIVSIPMASFHDDFVAVQS